MESAVNCASFRTTRFVAVGERTRVRASDERPNNPERRSPGHLCVRCKIRDSPRVPRWYTVRAYGETFSLVPKRTHTTTRNNECPRGGHHFWIGHSFALQLSGSSVVNFEFRCPGTYPAYTRIKEAPSIVFGLSGRHRVWNLALR